MKAFWLRHQETLLGFVLLIGLGMLIGALIYYGPTVADSASKALFGISFKELTALPPSPEEITPDCKQVHVVLPHGSFYGNLCIMPGGQTVCLFSNSEKINVCYPNPGVVQ